MGVQVLNGLGFSAPRGNRASEQSQATEYEASWPRGEALAFHENSFFEV
jgi:hypothetical protein